MLYVCLFVCPSTLLVNKRNIMQICIRWEADARPMIVVWYMWVFVVWLMSRPLIVKCLFDWACLRFLFATLFSCRFAVRWTANPVAVHAVARHLLFHPQPITASNRQMITGQKIVTVSDFTEMPEAPGVTTPRWYEECVQFSSKFSLR